MSKAATFACSLTIVGDGENLSWAPATAIGDAASPAEVIPVTTSNGTVSQALPAGAVGFVVVPPVGSILPKILKFNVGDTGGPISTAFPSPYDWEGSLVPPATIWFTSTGIETFLLYVF